MRFVKLASMAAVIAMGTLLSGCATKESVEHAQSTADLADSDAKAARGAADRAQSTADGAAKQAGDAMTLAQQANDKIDKYISDQEMKKKQRSAMRRHHRRHVAAATPPANENCPTPQQKTELRHDKKQASAQKLPIKTASK
ncbi:outer membrane murein-binding lipoprotein Lpp [Rhizomicrobium palustre]|uniref:Outer membrane murein-binding lipoprotein Lpp n=1 Tax=Rhizomicrobium palustre TaxID=189966 RepID=A0A846MWJ9_9PROT|nr:alanine-zipper protein [Rhizomicrobium palustre]NIK87367.1 outer membrane murein-binding lipoprotein Lpp [Rhizomicrobium palustre]